jgi:3-oxoacyl-[acyl-carrier protein] reductase
MSSLTGRIALVTGASKGIGAGVAQCLAATGATVIVGYAKDREGADRTVSKITRGGGEAWALEGDFSHPEDITRAFSKIETKHGHLDVLVNNAGVAGFGALDKVTPEEFHRIFNLNVLGLMLSTQASVKLMTKGGSVVNISSMAGAMPGAFSSIYSASKGAVNNLTISLSKELGVKQIRVNAVAPALTATEGLEAAGFMKGELFEKAVKMTPLGRAGKPDDIGKIVEFLASDESYWLTGQIIHATGGLTL